jgi:hypothetical protein
MSETRRTRALPADGPMTIAILFVVANLVVVALVLRPPVSPSMTLAAVLLVPLAVAAAAALVQRPQRGVLVIAALVPLDGLRILLPIPAGWKETLVLVTVAATFIAPREARGAVGRRLPSWVPFVATLFVLSLVSAALVGGSNGLTGLKIGFFYLLVALAAWRCPLDAKERDRLVTILMGMGVITAAVGLLQQVVGAERLVELGYQYNRDIRFSGAFLRSISTFNQSFPFALFLMLVLLIGLPCALEESTRLRNRLFLGSVPLLLLALAFTVTRAGWLGLVVGLVYLGVRHHRVLLASAIHGVVVAAVVLLLLSGFTAAFFATSSGVERVDIWRANVGEIGRHPLGIGIGTTGSAGEKANVLAGEEGNLALQPDNYYFKTTLELGIVGLWLLVLVLATAFASAQSAASRLAGRDAAFASGVAAMVLAVGAVSTVATYFEIFPMELYFWLFLTVVATCVRESS